MIFITLLWRDGGIFSPLITGVCEDFDDDDDMMAVMVMMVVVMMVVILKVWYLPPNIVSLLEKRHLKSNGPLGVTLNLIGVRDRPNCLIPVVTMH